MDPASSGNGWIRHPLAWLMEAADDICYLTVDLEDAAWIGMISVDTLCDLYRPVIGDDEIRRGRRMDDTPRMIQYFRSRMIKALINSCVEIYAEHATAIDQGTLGSTEAGSGILAHTRHAQAMSDIRTFSRDQIYHSKVTQDARQGFRRAMITTMEALTGDLIDVIKSGNGEVHSDGPLDVMVRKANGMTGTLASLPHARLGTQVPQDPSQAFPWLLDQITLMSDAQVLDLSQRVRRG